MGKRTKEPHICHYCKLALAPRFIVPCKVPCGRFFCRKCLTRYYKFSRTKCAKLPSATWRCPVCTKKCYCESCQDNAILSSSKCKNQFKNPEKKKIKNHNMLQKTEEDPEGICRPNTEVYPSIEKTKDRLLASKDKESLPPFYSICLKLF